MGGGGRSRDSAVGGSNGRGCRALRPGRWDVGRCRCFCMTCAGTLWWRPPPLRAHYFPLLFSPSLSVLPPSNHQLPLTPSLCPPPALLPPSLYSFSLAYSCLLSPPPPAATPSRSRARVHYLSRTRALCLSHRRPESEHWHGRATQALHMTWAQDRGTQMQPAGGCGVPPEHLEARAEVRGLSLLKMAL